METMIKKCYCSTLILKKNVEYDLTQQFCKKRDLVALLCSASEATIPLRVGLLQSQVANLISTTARAAAPQAHAHTWTTLLNSKIMFSYFLMESSLS